MSRGLEGPSNPPDNRAMQQQRLRSSTNSTSCSRAFRRSWEPEVMEPDAIDFTKTAALGDPSTEAGRGALAEIFRLYFENAAAACTDMRTAGSPDEVRRHAHRAKGAS